LQALRDAGKDPDALTHEDLAPMDEFHIRGRNATKELAAIAEISASDHVLDVGCGIGGPSRNPKSPSPRPSGERGCAAAGSGKAGPYSAW